MARYASKTDVSVDRSKGQIQKLLRQYGAVKIATAWDGEAGRDMIAFEFERRSFRIEANLPDPNDKEFTLTPTGQERHPDTAYKAWEQAARSHWRFVHMFVKMALEAIEQGSITMDQAFLGFAILPSGQTMADWYGKELRVATDADQIPALMPGQGE